jgi:hypothetical protein
VSICPLAWLAPRRRQIATLRSSARRWLPQQMKENTMIEDKIARICWNTNYWQKPSGKNGKSRNKKAYENLTGYGHEEWLLDTEKTIDGYHYAYLQAIGTHRKKYIGNTFNISLYSINNVTKERWWIGEIKNVIVTTPTESKKIYKIYKQKKWLKEMEAQLQEVDADVEDFQKIPPEYFSTIKFKPSDLFLLDEPKQFSHDDPAVTSDYYNLKNKNSEPQLIRGNFVFSSGHNKGKESSKRSYSASKKDNDLFHNRMQNAIYEQLCEECEKNNVGTEQDTGFGSRVDIAVKQKNGTIIFYELKTSNSIRQCIREGLSQLMEYSFFPNKNNAAKLIIVSQNKIDQDNEIYIKKLRSSFEIPVYYQQFNTETNKLEAKQF